MHGYLRNADTWLRSCFEISTFFADFPADSRQAPRNTHRLTGHYGTITASLAAASAPCARLAFSATAANQPSSATFHFSRHGSEERLLALSSSVPVMAPRKRRAPAPATADDRSITVALPPVVEQLLASQKEPLTAPAPAPPSAAACSQHVDRAIVNKR
jgi:hypothetical protein